MKMSSRGPYKKNPRTSPEKEKENIRMIEAGEKPPQARRQEEDTIYLISQLNLQSSALSHPYP
jgi:hypothetical protein